MKRFQFLETLKKVLKGLLIIYILLCVIIHFSYESMIRTIGNNEIVYRSFSGGNYLVFLEDENVNFVILKDISLDIFNAARIPIVTDRITYNLAEPQQSTEKYRFMKGTTHTLDDKNNLLENGLVVEAIGGESIKGMFNYKNIYFGVSKDKYKLVEGLTDISNYYSDELNKNYYFFRYESEDKTEFDKLFNIGLY